jgi:hypothetical protein
VFENAISSRRVGDRRSSFAEISESVREWVDHISRSDQVFLTTDYTDGHGFLPQRGTEGTKQPEAKTFKFQRSTLNLPQKRHAQLNSDSVHEWIARSKIQIERFNHETHQTYKRPARPGVETLNLNRR